METIQHELQLIDPGMVWLDKDNRILAINDVAIETLGARPGELLGEDVLQLHPEASRENMRLLLEQASSAADAPPPATAIINIPERLLLIKVSKMRGRDDVAGTCMVIYDLTDATTRQRAADQELPGQQTLRRLHKLPVYKDKQVLLVDLEAVCCIKADGRYSKLYTESGDYFCNLAISDLESRLDERMFFRVHRSHLVNLRYAKAFEKIDEQCYLIMDHQDGIKVPISRNKFHALKQVLGLS